MEINHIEIEVETNMVMYKREISVLFDSINVFQIIQLLEYYNSNKPYYWKCLDVLDRSEGGFKLVYDNNTYNDKHLRWHKKRLVPHIDYKEFNYQEILLLYKALCHVFGKNSVILQDFY